MKGSGQHDKVDETDDIVLSEFEDSDTKVHRRICTKSFSLCLDHSSSNAGKCETYLYLYFVFRGMRPILIPMKSRTILNSVRAMDADLNGVVGAVRAVQESITKGYRTLEIGRPFPVQIDCEQTKIHRIVRGLGDRFPGRASESPLRNSSLSGNHIHVRLRYEFRADVPTFAIAFGPDGSFLACASPISLI
jgi:hypothetical protein